MKLNKSRPSCLLVVCACLMLAVCSSTATAQSNPLPEQKSLNRVGLERVWWGNATLNPARDKVSFVTVDEDAVFVQSNGGVITAFNSETGEKLWSQLIGSGARSDYPVATSENLVIVGSGLQLYALDRYRGGIIWQLNLPTVLSTTPALDRYRIYLPCMDGSVYAYSLRRIRELYEENRLPKWSKLAEEWRYKTGKEVTSSPVTSGRVVSFASLDGSLYTLTTQYRKLAYQFETDAPVSAPLVKTNKYILLASRDFSLYCLNANNGQVRWSFLSGLPILNAPHVIDESVFVMPQNAGMYVVNVENGKPMWPAIQERAVGLMAASRNRVYAHDRIGNVLVLDKANGNIEGELPLHNFDIKPTNYRTDRIVLANSRGLVTMLREQGENVPTYHQYPERRPIIPELYVPEKTEEPEQNKPSINPFRSKSVNPFRSKSVNPFRSLN